MRLYSVRGLGELRDPQARDLLERLRAGDDARLSREAAEAAAKIEAGGKRPGP
jgi:HEAT repeat protein